ncbi:ATP-dependent RecD-like DNA helicase [Facklamia sp. DSM 111018]|uniref:ATP-dependent RecD2 DNA helicase n=1 Tax=Facklamia lactis TaxID=2749967 RepID=A0ABS0LN90_9LACT|nr:ATP-dependent RecD-like DNA helicase [Facklamia lactis]MBG9979695.1 ATP-dependent RecD-like DNA helicase [Facklamia lactis]MBG9985625.1 ATP-dependent RecD-like DNA helicase [Facklamia lactis]
MEEEILVGTVDAIYFENDSNFYKVMRILVDMDQTDLLVAEEMVVTGQFVSIHLDTPYQFFGQITSHPKYGEQFAATRYQQLIPSSEQGLVDYLSSKRFKGIGDKTATKIVETLGEKAVEMILNDATALDKVPGLSSKNALNLRNTLMQQQGTERIFIKLGEWGFGPKISDRIYKTYKSHTLDKIQENPYQLVDTIEGVGFRKADQLAEQLGISPDSIHRIESALVMAVAQASLDEGDTYIEIKRALLACRELLEASRPYLIEDELLEKALDSALTHEKLLVVGEDLVLPSIFYAEYGTSQKIKQFMDYELVERFTEEEIDEALEDVMALVKIAYDANQRAALKLAIQSPMSIITGGPGTGKTTLVKGIIYLHAILHGYDFADLQPDNRETPIRLAAPTGRAAKRLQESAQLPASTIHRLIGYTRDSVVNEFEPLIIEGSLLIVDEMSMVDVWLMNWLMQAIPYEMQVVFVGDKDQLPSVGPGKVFSDMISSQQIPTVSLQRIYRQAEGSSIVKLAHHIRQGQLPADFLEKQSDRSFIPCNSQQIPRAISQIVAAAVKKGFTGQNMQVLAPMYKGPAGINVINEIMQEMLNPPQPKRREIKHFDRIYRVGDKVLQLVNNAEEGVYNGDIGKIISIFTAKETESKSEEVVVAFDEIELTYKKSELDQLTLAYCCSIHKAQGTEYDLVILPLVDLYSRMLRRDILYTAITRASQSLVMLGNPDSFKKAISQKFQPRKTNLEAFLQLQFEKQSTSETADQKTIEQSVNANIETFPAHESSLQLRSDTIWQIDPMIGMEGLSPYDFMPNK